MKTYFISAFLLVAAPAFAAYQGPLLVKTTQSGFTVPEYTQSQRCEIYADHVVKSQVIGRDLEFKTKETRSVQTTADFASLLKGILASPIVTENGPVDVATVSYTGIQANALGVMTKVIIRSENGGTGEIQARDSAKARTTLVFIDSLCQ